MARQIVQSVSSSTLADILERVLDKGIVIAGDIKVKLVNIELLTIQIRLLVASVDKAKEMGMDWWSRNPDFSSSPGGSDREKEIEDLKAKISSLERRLPEHGAGGCKTCHSQSSFAEVGDEPHRLD